MTDTTTTSRDTRQAKPGAKEKRRTKATQVEAMLARKSGATLEQLCEATGWQSHTCRAFLSRLRKKGREVVRETSKGGKTVYRLAAPKAAAKAD